MRTNVPNLNTPKVIYSVNIYILLNIPEVFTLCRKKKSFPQLYHWQIENTTRNKTSRQNCIFKTLTREEA